MKIGSEIITKYLTGKLSDEELREFELWISESENNRLLLSQYQTVLQITDTLYTVKRNREEVEPNFQQLKNRIQKNTSPKGLRFWMRQLQRVAAILFIPLLLGSIYILTKSEELPAVRYAEFVSHSGMVSTFELPDGTKVWLNADGRIRYPMDFRGDTRHIELEGQAYFEVVKDAEKPFLVEVEGNMQGKYVVEVLGTSFSISAYNNENKIETSLLTGSVNLLIEPKGMQEIKQKLVPGEKAIFSKVKQTFSICKIDVKNEIAWRDGMLMFDNMPMEQVLNILSRQYNVDFDIKDKRVMLSHITGWFQHEQLSQILQYLEIASGLKYKINKPEIVDGHVLKRSVVELYK